jgi:hypothetical protein
MVMLFLSAFDPQANHREFSCLLPSLEDNCDFLSTLVQQGNTLLTAYLLEEGVRTPLPLAAFDGLPLSPALQRLEHQWQLSLKGPSSVGSVHREELIGLTRRRLHLAESHVSQHQRMITCFGHWLERTQATSMPELLKAQLLDRYQGQLSRHQAQLAKARVNLALITDRFHQLAA